MISPVPNVWQNKSNVSAHNQYYSQYPSHPNQTIPGGQYLEAMISPHLNMVGSVGDGKTRAANSSVAFNANPATSNLINTSHNNTAIYTGSFPSNTQKYPEGYLNDGRGAAIANLLPATDPYGRLQRVATHHDPNKAPSFSGNKLNISYDSARFTHNNDMVSDGVAASGYGTTYDGQMPLNSAISSHEGTLVKDIPKNDYVVSNTVMLNQDGVTTKNQHIQNANIPENDGIQTTQKGNRRRRHHRRHYHRHKHDNPYSLPMGDGGIRSDLHNTLLHSSHINTIHHKPVHSHIQGMPLPRSPSRLYLPHRGANTPSEHWGADANAPIRANAFSDGRGGRNENIVRQQQPPHQNPPHNLASYLAGIPPPPGGWNAFYSATASNNHIIPPPRPTGPQEPRHMGTEPTAISNNLSYQNAYHTPHHMHNVNNAAFSYHTPARHQLQQLDTNAYENGYLRYKREIGQLPPPSLTTDGRGTNLPGFYLEDQVSSSRSASYTSSWSSYSCLSHTSRSTSSTLSSLSGEDCTNVNIHYRSAGDDEKRSRRDQKTHSLCQNGRHTKEKAVSSNYHLQSKKDKKSHHRDVPEGRRNKKRHEKRMENTVHVEGNDNCHRDRRHSQIISSVTSTNSSTTSCRASSANIPNQPVVSKRTSSYSNTPRNNLSSHTLRSHSQIEESRMKQIALRALQKGGDFRSATREPLEKLMNDGIITSSQSKEEKEKEIIGNDNDTYLQPYQDMLNVDDKSSNMTKIGNRLQKGDHIIDNIKSLNFPSNCRSTTNGASYNLTTTNNVHKNKTDGYRRSTVSSSFSTAKISGRTTPIKPWGVNARPEPTTRAKYLSKAAKLNHTSTPKAQKLSMNNLDPVRYLAQNQNNTENTDEMDVENFKKSQQQHSYRGPELFKGPSKMSLLPDRHNNANNSVKYNKPQKQSQISQYPPDKTVNTNSVSTHTHVPDFEGNLRRQEENQNNHEMQRKNANERPETDVSLHQQVRDNIHQMRQTEHLRQNMSLSPNRAQRQVTKSEVLQNAAAALAMVNMGRSKTREHSQRNQSSSPRSPMSLLSHTMCQSSHANKLREELQLLEERWNKLSVIQAKARSQEEGQPIATYAATEAAKCHSPETPQVFNMKDPDKHINNSINHEPQCGSLNIDSPPVNIPVGCRPNVARVDHSYVNNRGVREDHDAILRLIRRRKELTNNH